MIALIGIWTRTKCTNGYPIKRDMLFLETEGSNFHHLGNVEIGVRHEFVAESRDGCGKDRNVEGTGVDT